MLIRFRQRQTREARHGTGRSRKRRLAALAVTAALLTPFMAAATASSPARAAVSSIPESTNGGFLRIGQWMYPGTVIWSDPDPWFGSQDHLEMQYDGNLVLYHRNGPREPGGDVAVWASNTQGQGNRARMDRSGNFVLYNARGRALWSARPPGAREDLNAVLKVQSDDKLVIYSGDPYWIPLFQSCEWNRVGTALPFCPI